ncbi:hypothetical protein PMEGAS67_61810 [Priestia megaterium]
MAIAKKIKPTPAPSVIIVLLLIDPNNVKTDTTLIIVTKQAKKYFTLYNKADAKDNFCSSRNVIKVLTLGKKI